ncbi:MAG: hypothetical protein IT385_10735 [Deltaproteobacteria bacterium]|nr:hypothetical protein [Deltaproteobacteria bacterium]
MRVATPILMLLLGCNEQRPEAAPAPTPVPAPTGEATPAPAPRDAPAPNAAPAPAPAQKFVPGRDYQVLERVRFLDSQGFDRPVEAYSLLLPEGWKSEGGVRWGRVDQCRSEMIGVWMKASSPDGKVRVDVMPPRGFGWAEDPQMMQILQTAAQNGGCGVNPPFTAQQFIEAMAQHELGAVASDFRVDEKSMATTRQNDQQANAISQQYGNGMTQETTVTYAKLVWPDGTEGIAHAGVTNSVTRRRDMLTGAMTSWSTTQVFHNVVFRFPAADREQSTKLFAMMQSSHRVNPVWSQAKDDFLTRLGNIEHAERMERIRLVGEQARAYAAERSAAMDRQLRDWERGQRAQERQVKGFIQTIREVETWNDGSGGVELSAGYERAWSRGDGRYILSNKPGFDPSSAFLDPAWQPMTRADP